MSRSEYLYLCGAVFAAVAAWPATTIAKPATGSASLYPVTCSPVVAVGSGISSVDCKVSGTGIVELEADATLVGAKPKSVMTIAVDGQPCAQPSQGATAAAKVDCRSVFVKDSTIHVVLQHAGASVAPDTMKVYAAALK